MTAVRGVSTAVVEFARVWGGLALVVIVGFVITYQFVGAPPPKAVRIATGAPGGAYHAFAEHYARLLADDGIELDVVETAGSLENLALLREGRVELALVQGGTAAPEDADRLQTLGSLFLEPLWLFTRTQTPIARLSDLKGVRVAVGAEGSGTNRLATQVLAAAGVTPGTATLLPLSATDAGRALEEGHADAAVIVASPTAEYVKHLAQQPDIALFDFERAAAFSRVFPYLSPVTLDEGILDLERNIPPRNTTLVAVASMLAARRDLNPNLVPAVLAAVTRVHQAGGILEQRRQFPSIDYVDLPLNAIAERYIQDGPSFLYRWLPYGTAVVLDRLKILILPFLVLLLPVFRIGPTVYQWRIRSRIYRWYASVREIDAQVRPGLAPAQARPLGTRLSELEKEVSAVSVPLAYAGELYHLRMHIDLLQHKVSAMAGRAAADAELPSPPPHSA